MLCHAVVPRFYAPDNSQVTVEQLALQHYASHEGGTWQGLHCEGGVFATLFTLLLWDVIFKGGCPVSRLRSLRSLFLWGNFAVTATCSISRTTAQRQLVKARQIDKQSTVINSITYRDVMMLTLYAHMACCDVAGVPDVFRSPFQTSPLDLDTDAFYPARRTQLDTQLARIADGHAGQLSGLGHASACIQGGTAYSHSVFCSHHDDHHTIDVWEQSSQSRLQLTCG